MTDQLAGKWSTIYAMNGMSEAIFRPERLDALMQKRGIGPGELEYLAGVSYNMVYLLRKNERPNVSVVIAAKISQALGTSLEYLFGLTDNPAPPSLWDPPADLIDFFEIYQQLSPSRQSDLQVIAKALLTIDQSRTE